jgi:meso-butanediol dehydrogenase/(S,S)-butanediol dehydrogenase/diacetyl reductase
MGKSMYKKVVFITGASEGIGRATAIRLAGEGATVIICARRPEPLAETEAEIRRRGGKVDAFTLDVGDTEAYAKAIRDAAARHGRLDGLVNNAMSGGFASVLDTTVEAWRKDFTVNAEAVFVGTREALRIMCERRSGAIVNIATLNALRAMSYMASYSASKAALVQFSAVAAMEAAPYGVRVNVIAPGQIMTPALQQFARMDPDRAAKSTAAIPMGRGGEPEELASAVLFLLSDEASFITGVTLPVDGGKSVQLYMPS